MKSKCRIITGDCLKVLKKLKDSSADSMATDPPAGIIFLGLTFDTNRGGRDKWIEWLSEVFRECFRVLKPGAHALVWAIPRTSHWTATALEDAGFEIRDSVHHLFATGMPKGVSIGKRISSERWAGWNTALTPGHEVWWLCRKPLSERSIVANVTKHGTGAVNIGACRTGSGRWPKNVVLSHSLDCKRLGVTTIKGNPSKKGKDKQYGGGVFGGGLCRVDSGYTDEVGMESVEAWDCASSCSVNSLGEKARYFPTFACFAKASRKDRGKGNDHPTVKHTELMQWLCRLITPPGGTVLDPFLGSGSTAIACKREGFGIIGIEMEKRYVEIARRRLEQMDDTEYGMAL